MEQFPIRTDLALESKERLEAARDDMRGVVVEEIYDEKRNVIVTKVKVVTENGAKALGKPIGTYLTLEAPDLILPDTGTHREVSEALSEQLKELLGPEIQSVLVVGLGNREVTPDALGPKVVGNLYITRHLLREYGSYAFRKEKVAAISGIVPGVMAQTGMETVEIVRGIIQQTKPQLVIAVDALAARSVKRLGRTIQLANTGIHPGSGVGNHRKGLNVETLGVPVIAIGVPTVVDAATIVYDVCQDVERFPNGIAGMFVTPKNIDETIKNVSFTISEALNMTFDLNF
jgi:spore protease